VVFVFSEFQVEALRDFVCPPVKQQHVFSVLFAVKWLVGGA